MMTPAEIKELENKLGAAREKFYAAQHEVGDLEDQIRAERLKRRQARQRNCKHTSLGTRTYMGMYDEGRGPPPYYTDTYCRNCGKIMKQERA